MALALIGAGCTATSPANDLWSQTTAGNAGTSSPAATAKSSGTRTFGSLFRRNQDAPQFTGSVETGTGRFVNDRPLTGEGPTVTGSTGITLNLVEVPIRHAAKTILGDVLALNYTVDQRVEGNVTVQTTKAVSRDALVGIFETVLKTRGASIVEEGGFYKIIPSSEIAASAAPVSLAGSRAKGPGVRVEVVPLRFVSAEEMTRLLEPVSPPGAILQVDPVRNLLMLSGTGGELATMRETIELFDADWLKGMSFALHPLKTNDPAAIVKELDAVFATEAGPLKGVVRFVPNKRLKSILVITSRPHYLAKAQAWIERLDRMIGANEQQLFVYSIQNRAATELAALLQSVFRTERGRGVAVENSVAPKLTPAIVTAAATGPAASASAIGAPEAGLIAGPPLVETVDAPADMGGGDGEDDTGAPEVRVVPDEANNALLIVASPDEYERMLGVLETLDLPPNQVMIEAVIVEVSLTDELKLGVRWFFEDGNFGLRLSDAAGGAVGSVFPGFSYLFSTSNFGVVLDALSSVTDVNVVSSPTLMVLDNRTATLQVGDQVPVVTQSAHSTTDANAPVVNAVEMKDTGVILSVTPRVNDSGRVVLTIEQEVSNVVRTTTSGIDSPTIRQRKISTTIAVGDGESLALGGLMQERDNRTRSQVPVLGDIPLLGNAFKNKLDTIERTELIIFIKPRVVRDPAEARKVTEEFRRQLDLQAPPHAGAKTKLERDARRLIH